MHRHRRSFAGLALVLLAPAAAAQSSFFNVVSVTRTLEARGTVEGEAPEAFEMRTFEGTGPFDLELSAVALTETGARGSGLATVASDARLSRVRFTASATAMSEPAPFDLDEPHQDFIYPTSQATATLEYIFEALRPAQIQFRGFFGATVSTPYDDWDIDAGVLLETLHGATLFERGFERGTEDFNEVILLEPGVHRLMISVDGFHKISSAVGEILRSSSLDVDVHFIPAPTTATPLLLAFGAIATRRRRP